MAGTIWSGLKTIGFFIGYPEADDWQTAVDTQFRKENIDFWHNYVGKSVPRESVEEALYDLYLLNTNTTNAFFSYLINKKDTEALQYWMSLKGTDSVAAAEKRWQVSAWCYNNEFYYSNDDSPQDQAMDVSILNVRQLDESCIEKCKNLNIKNRYVLQVLRKYFYSAKYQKCVDVWEKYGKNVPQSALRTQCVNYYGGALLRLGRKADAAIAYSTIGYSNYYLHYNIDVLREVYKQQPNSSSFEFMVQQFVNRYFDSPNPVKAEEFYLLAEQILKEKKNSNPALWKSAQAAFAYMGNDVDFALRLIAEAERLKGTPIVKENIRFMRLIFNSSRTDNDNKYEETIYSDLRWLAERINKDLSQRNTHYDYYWGLYGEDPYTSNLPYHRVKVLRRVVFLGAVPHFERIGEAYKSIAYLNLYQEVFSEYKEERKISRERKKAEFADSWFYTHNFDYSTDFFNYMDTTSLENVLKYVDFLISGGKTAAEKFIVSNSYKDMNYLYDIVGTKYIRREQFSDAVKYFEKVSNDFLKTQNISEYIGANRNPFEEFWITNESELGKYDLSFDPAEEYAEAPCKLTFSKIMLRLKNESVSAKTAAERAKAAYAYAVGLHQSSFLGYAWALQQYSQSSSHSDFYGLSGDYDFDCGYDFPEENQKNDAADYSSRVDLWLDKALKYNAEKIFTMKCKILHSKTRDSMQEIRTVKNSCFSFKRKTFKADVQSAFCDRLDDYDNPNAKWRHSAWYY